MKKRINLLVITLVAMIMTVGFVSVVYADGQDSQGPFEWSLSSTSVTCTTNDLEMEVPIIYSNDDEIFESELVAESSNTNIVDAYITFDTDDKYCLFLYFGDIGEADVTVTDKWGQTAVCHVTIKPNPLILDPPSYNLNTYDEDCDTFEIHSEDWENDIVSAVSSNTKVVKIIKISDDEYEFEPTGAGTANITVTDNYGQTAVLKVTVSQKYIDEYKYIFDLKGISFSGLYYGEKELFVWDNDINATVSTKINDKTYTATVNADGDYVIKNLPKINAGTKLTITMQKGQAKTTKTVTVDKAYGSNCNLSAKSATYTGKALKPAITVKDGSTTLKNGTDYTVKYSSNTKVGQGKATVTFKGNYKGSKSVNFKINPKKTSVTNATGAKKAATVKWKKVTAQTTGYQIQYSTSKSFSSKKTVTVKSNKTTSKKLTNLKAKKKYYVRVRTYKTVNGKKYYSAWSNVKTVKTK